MDDLEWKKVRPGLEDRIILAFLDFKLRTSPGYAPHATFVADARDAVHQFTKFADADSVKVAGIKAWKALEEIG